jgi:hypothetical protein
LQGLTVMRAASKKMPVLVPPQSKILCAADVLIAGWTGNRINTRV